ncbi:MAG: BTAD domain-containing putative transcriptional regulator, partial [Gemmatimonadota bacterium]
MTDGQADRRARLNVLGYMELEDATGRSVVTVLRRPKLAALLCVLAVGSSAVRSRERLMAMFWPDASASKASHSLNQLVYQLRKELGDVIERRGDQLVVDRDRLWCDVDEFERQLELSEHSEVAGLYRGAFLEGLYLSDAPEFERWVEVERGRLARAASQSLWSLAEGLAAESKMVEAANAARRAARLMPGEESTMRRLLGFLDGIGDRAGAISAYDDFARFLRSEFEVAPSPETTALIDRIRSREAVVADIPVRRPDLANDLEEPEGVATAPGLRGDEDRARPPSHQWLPRRWALAAVATVGVMVLGASWLRSVSSARPDLSGPVSLRVDRASSTSTVLDEVARTLVGDLSQTERFAVLDAEGTGSTDADLIVRLAAYGAGQGAMVEVRLVDARTNVVAAVRTFPASEASPGAVRFVRQRTGSIVSRRAMEGAASEEVLSLMRRADRLEAEGAEQRRAGLPLIAWSHLMAADTALMRAERGAPDWVEPTLRRGWLALERVLILTETNAADSTVLDLTRDSRGFAQIYLEAEQHAERVLQRRPSSSMGFELRGAVAYSQLQPIVFADDNLRASAIADLTRAVELDPHLPQAWLRLSRLWQAEGDLGRAYVAVGEAVATDPYLRYDQVTARFLLRGATWANDGTVARTTCVEGRRLFPEDDVFAECSLFMEGWLGDTSSLARAQAAFDSLDASGDGVGHRRGLRMLYLAGAAARSGDVARARALIEQEGALPRSS